MAEPLPQNNQSQATGPQPSAVPQQTSSQQPFHPMVVGQNYMPPSPLPHLSQGVRPPESEKSKTIITIGNLSLFSMVSSLIFLGAFTFLGGFLLGMWFERPRGVTYVVASGGEESAPLQQLAPVASQEGGESQPSGEPKKKEKGIADVAGMAAKKAISEIPLPKAPGFLTPFLKETKEHLGEKAAHEATQAIQQAQKVVTQPAPQSPSVQKQSSLSPEKESTSLNSAPQLVAFTQETPGPSTASMRSSPQNGEEVYSVQLGVYAAKENAYMLKDYLQSLNYMAYVTEGKSEGGNSLYYVNSGRYDNYSTASKAASQFASQNIMPGAIVVKLLKNNKDGL